MNKPLRIVLAEDHTLVRAGLRTLLQQLDQVAVVGEAADGREAVMLAKALRPDMILMDITMPGLNGIDATRQVKKDLPEVRVVILSMHSSEEHVMQALRAGASGYLLKESAPLELELALRAVGRGETYLSPPISRQVIDGYMQRVSDTTQDALASLSARQREILQLIAEGSSSKVIARRLGLSVKTVESHRAQLMERLQIRDIAGLVRYAIRTGLISAEK
jgi:DNA-binding NarL/FixJ family response regulator